MGKILVLDDDILMLNIAKEFFGKDGHEVVCIEKIDDLEITELVKKENPDVVVLDIHFPNAPKNGFDLCADLQTDPYTRNIPVLLVTGVYRDLESKVAGFELGGSDFITKPFDPRELLARTYSLMRFKQKIDSLMADKQSLEHMKDRYWELSITDHLTRAFNRGYFEHRFSTELKRARRTGEIMGLLMMDLDHFKQINDTYGHLAGDEVLKTFAATVKGRLRYTDIFARWGGEEFVALLFNIEPTVLPNIAEDIRKRVEKATVHYDGKEIKFTVSIGGIVIHPNDPDSMSGFMARVDEALYKAKQNGRNRVEIVSLPKELIRPRNDDN